MIALAIEHTLLYDIHRDCRVLALTTGRSVNVLEEITQRNNLRVDGVITICITCIERPE